MFWYTHLEFIAHAIPTMPAYHQGRYIAARGSDNVDIRNRAFVMECVADVALTRAHDSSGTLKIFVAPEFFFRGRTGAYGLDGLQQVVRAIKLWASAKKFEHWLFFCGTVVATFENDRNEREIVNVAIVQHGGPSGATYTVMKEALAPDDFLTNGQLAQARRPQRGALTMETIVGVKNLQQFDALTNRGAGAEAQKKPYDGRGIFDDARIRFGVEVCADHLVSKLAKSPTSMFDWHPQVQVVTACGVQYIVADSVVASKGGYAFLCDGFFAATQDGVAAHSELRKITTARNGTTAATTTAIAKRSTIALERRLTRDWKSGFSAAGELHFYPRQDAPWSSLRLW
ncbi:MAG: hypothetical protein MUF34_37575 [Polyangiaceae bacterium]|jgi:hypothetical protein|nr:hypothetical protein [Polyangiaceae bacterium]